MDRGRRGWDTFVLARMGSGTADIVREQSGNEQQALGQAASRANFYERARAADLSAQLHFVDVPKEERWRRVVTRNSGKGGAQQLTFEVTREMFDFVESMWEPPDPEEMSAHDGVNPPSG